MSTERRIAGNEAPARNAWRTCAAIGLGLLFIAAGIAKTATIFQFRSTIDALVVQVFGGTSLPLVPLRQAVTIAVPAAEIALGTALIIGASEPRRTAILSAAFLTVLSMALVVILTMNNPPSCGCFGSWEVFRANARTEAVLGLLRNTGLLMLAVWLGFGRAPATATPRARDAATLRPGFTLVELLVVIAIATLLIAILLPALSHAKRAGQQAKWLSATRQSLTGLTQYSDAEQGFMPFLATPEHPELGVFPDGDWEQQLPPSYFRGQAQLWPTALLAHGIDLSHLPMNTRPETGPDRVHTYFWMTHAAVSRPSYWTGIDPPPEMSLFSGVRLDEVLFPSAKGCLAFVGHSSSEGHRVTTWEVGMFDGSAEARSLTDPPVTVDGPYRRYGAIDWRVLTTYEGVRGRDY